MARQKLGQHFLIRSSILERIAAAACPEREPLVIEIGPGQGALTHHLLARADRVIAIELDAALARKLMVVGQARGLRGALGPAGGRPTSPPQAESLPHLQVIEADALTVDLSQWGLAVIAGNLPYYAATAIIERVLDLGSLLRRGVFLVQKEVAERITAEPGSRDYGYLSVTAQSMADVEKLFEVQPAAFRPPPKVDSAVLLFHPRDRAAELGIADRRAFLRFVSLCFRQKRKTLRNNLAEYRAMVDTWPEAGLRAEQVDFGQFADMYRRLVT